MSQSGVKVLMKLVVYHEQYTIFNEKPSDNPLFDNVIKYCKEILDITHQNFHLTAMELNCIRNELVLEWQLHRDISKTLEL